MSQFADNGHYVSVRGSYGIQGNIHDDATPNLILEVGTEIQQVIWINLRLPFA